MKYLRLFSAVGLLAFTITGCHSRREGAVLPPSAAPPDLTNSTPLPAAAPATVPLVAPPSVTPPPPITPPAVNATKQAGHTSRHRPAQKTDSETGQPSATQIGSSSTDVPGATTTTAANSGAGASSPIGRLSAEDAVGNPERSQETEQLIQGIEKRLKKMTGTQRTEHKDAVMQISSFVKQAKQALTMNDLVGAQTLANKAKILLDELEK